MAGDKIAKAKEAVRMAIGRMRDSDIVSLVAYDSDVRVLVPATRLTDRGALFAAIDALTADHSTALFAGVSKGAAEVRKFFEKDRVNRVILLSDGLANVGPSSPSEFGELGKSLGREGITVTTIGLGLDYNEDLMFKLASYSDGNHMFAERASDLESAFAQEFGDLMAVVAQQVQVTIRCTDGVRPVRVLGREANIVGNTVTLALNQLYGGQTKYVILEVEVPGGQPGATRDLAVASAAYVGMDAKRRNTHDKRVAAAFSESAAIVEAHTREDVMADSIYQLACEQSVLATRLRDEGKINEAKQVLFSNVQLLTENAGKLDDDRLREYASSNQMVVENLDGESWKRQRKILRVEQHEIITQQAN